MDIDYKKRLERHIKALDTAYENIIALLEEDIEMEEDKEKGGDKIKLKDSQIKGYSEGVEKCAKTADYLLSEIKLKQIELDELNKIIEPKTDSKKIVIEEKAESIENKDFLLENRLK